MIRIKVFSCWLAVVIGFLACGRDANAFTFNLTFSVGGDSAAFSSTATGILVVDTLGDGFQALADPALLEGATMKAQNSLLGTDDLVFAPATFLEIIDLKDGVVNGDDELGLQMNTRTFDTAGDGSGNWGANDPFAIFWFNNGTSNQGDPFGYFRSDDAAQGDVGFFTLNAGESKMVFNTSPKATLLPGSTTTMQFNANNGIVTPEPSSSLLVVLAGSLFLRRRRGGA